jgi:hypothetical protein
VTLDIQALPEKIKKSPHWRVNFRPSGYKVRIQGIAEPLDLIKETSIKLRGRRYPFLTEETQEQILEQNYTASGSDWQRHAEYWRLYYSGQFIHLFQVREKSDARWDEKLREEAEDYILPFTGKSDIKIPGFISILNLLYNLTEVFEFAARLCGRSLYQEELEIAVALSKIKGFALIAQYPKSWCGYYPATADQIAKSWTVSPEYLMAKSAELALEGALYFLGRFGWHNPSIEILREDQQKLLSGKI